MTVSRQIDDTIPGTKAFLLVVFLLFFSCTRKAEAHLLVMPTETDNDAPAVVVSIDSCLTSITIIFTDSLSTDSGIGKVSIREQLNCSVTLDTSRKPTLLTAVVTTNDPQLDVVYALEVADNNGNARYVRDTLQGLTLRFLPTGRESVLWPDGIMTQRTCDSIRLYNAGLLPYTVTGAYFADNTMFSSPLSQFPRTLAPGDSAALLVCFHPSADTLYHDTLSVGHHCRLITLPLYGRGVPVVIDLVADTRCGVRVHLGSSGTSLRPPVVYPNPATDRLTLQFDLAIHSTVAIRMSDVTGFSPVELPPMPYDTGTYEVELDVSHLETGFYLCELFIDGNRTVLPIQVVH